MALSLITALSVRSHLVAGREAMDRGKAQITSGDAAGATASFAQAERSFADAVAQARRPWMRVLGWVPLLGRTPDAVAGISEASEQTALAAHMLSQAVADTPGGLASLAPSGGRLSSDRLAGLAEAVRVADLQVGRALATVRAAPDSLLLGPVGEARRQAEEQLASIHDTLHTASLVLQGLPSFLGSDGPRYYFLAAANPAEERGTGGFIGAYDIVAIDDGRLTLSPVRAVQSLPTLDPSEVPAPNPDYARIYDPNRDGTGFWLNINATPDFPSAAQAIEASYRRATGQRLDGVITVDPFALAALLRVTGPATIPGYGIHLDAANVVDFTTNGAYSEFPNPRQRKVIIGSVAKSLFETFIHQSSTSIGKLRIVGRAAADGHILVYSDDPVMQAGLSRTGMGGALAAPPGDFLSIVQNNASASKVDYFLNRTVDYAIALGPDGSATAEVSVALDNGAPDSGQPRYVIGPTHKKGIGASQPGENVSEVNVYCGTGCLRTSASTQGDVKDFGHDSELGRPFYRYVFDMPSGTSADLDLALSLPQAWQGNSSGGTYRLTFLGQPTVRPTRVTIGVTAPAGMHIVSATGGMAIRGPTATWTGTPGRRLELEVRFQPSLPVRLWRDLTRFLARPAFHA